MLDYGFVLSLTNHYRYLQCRRETAAGRVQINSFSLRQHGINEDRVVIRFDPSGDHYIGAYGPNMFWRWRRCRPRLRRRHGSHVWWRVLRIRGGEHQHADEG